MRPRPLLRLPAHRRTPARATGVRRRRALADHRPREFLWVADQVATDTGLRLLHTPPAERREQRAGSAFALAAVEEVLKFLPEGADRVPEELFTSERGREVFHKNPRRFERAGLLENIARKRRILEGVDHVGPPPGA